MNAHDLCLIIDNDRELLRDWLRIADRPGDCSLSAQGAEVAFRRFTGCVRRWGNMTTLRAQIMDLIAERIDWEEVADHYNRKIEEGATA